jgi:hypothetical protein
MNKLVHSVSAGQEPVVSFLAVLSAEGKGGAR